MPALRLAELSRQIGAGVLLMRSLIAADRAEAISRMVAALSGAGLVLARLARESGGSPPIEAARPMR